MTSIIIDPFANEPQEGTTIVAEGKTKRILDIGGGVCWIHSKDDITAGDGAKHDVITGKAGPATETTCNVFTLLKAHGVPVAFHGKVSDATFAAPLCRMLPYEVVARGRAWGSYLKRNPEIEKGHRFDQPVVEFFLKTSNRQWREYPLECDDPFMEYSPGDTTVRLHRPDTALETPFLVLPAEKVLSDADEWRLFKTMQVLTQLVFLILEEEWHKQNMQFIDLKIEFGMHNGQPLVADVIDAESWRLLDQNGEPLSKQLYRDGGSLEDMKRVLEHVAECTKQFLPHTEAA